MEKMRNSENKKKKIYIIIGVILLAVVMIGTGFAIYVQDYYHADVAAMEAIESGTSDVIVQKEDSSIAFIPKHPVAGLIFYPGGKVEYEAYAPLMEALAEENVLCVLLHMPANLAVFDVDAADGIPEKYSQVDNWYIGGHSLGGSMAASYLAEKGDGYQGLILLASYANKDLHESGLKVLSVYGSEDGVLNRRAYEENRSNLPESFKEVIIDGGCHSYFGAYGHQEGDGTPTITREEQTAQTVAAIKAFINNN